MTFDCSEYYDAFVSIQRGLFNTRDRAEHTRKRKTISHTFSAKSIGQFEQYMHHNLEQLVKQWDRLSATAKSSGQEYADIDSLHWFNYLAFDIIGDLVSFTPSTTNHVTTTTLHLLTLQGFWRPFRHARKRQGHRRSPQNTR